MRWSVVRLISVRETRDLLRDRRTVMLILVLPALLYPLFGLAGTLFALSITGQTTVVGIVGMEELPQGDADASGKPPSFPALLVDGRFAELSADTEPDSVIDPEAGLGPIAIEPLSSDSAEALQNRTVDVVLVVSPGFTRDLEAGRKPTLTILTREGDERSKLAAQRLKAIVRQWENRVREVKLARAGLPKDFHEPFVLEDPQTGKPKEKRTADELRDTFARVFPFLLMMWLLAGAIQPAVDLTAGEKERGTMETLLISPAERAEIVAGKFLATTVFGFASVVWNVLWLTAGAVALGELLGFPILNLPGLVGCVIVGIPLAMLFSAVCLALGVFARSTKEGQYYLLPLILVTMPLAFWAMMPGAELDPGKALVPVTGALLLQKKLLSVSTEPLPWAYIAPVIGGLMLWVAIALWLAIRQFKNEAVLFRDTGPERVGLFAKIIRRNS
jgi:sodium transport system permease protein